MRCYAATALPLPSKQCNRLSRAGEATAHPGWTLARGWASQRFVANYGWELCQTGRPFATTSMRRSSVTGTLRRMFASLTWGANLAREPGASFAADSELHTGDGHIIAGGHQVQDAGMKGPARDI